jgi:transcriptional regulator GlxA family with amidase domain
MTPERRVYKGTKHIGIIGFDGVNAVDLVGPLEVFANAGRSDFASKRSKGAYELHVVGVSRAPFKTESGIQFVPDQALSDAPPMDTLIVPGGWGLREPATNASISAWLRTHAPRARRVASVCTGIYGLAQTGLLDGRQVTTHWRFTEDVARRFPKLKVERDALFLKDGRYYTSGGITAGIDLALALVQEDLGARGALAVAREMLVYLKRAGGQEQYSEPLRFQTRAVDSFEDLAAWLPGHLDKDLSVPVLAERAGLSPRHFTRRFIAAFECTPAEYVETLRLNVGRERLTSPGQTVERVAASIGFSSADVFRRRFKQRFGIAPSSYQERFRAPRPRERMESNLSRIMS